MQLQQDQARQLYSVIESQAAEKFNGVLSLTTQVDSWQDRRTCNLVFKKGAIVYGNSQIPSNQDFAKMLGNQLKPHLINAALSVAIEKLNNPTSVRELVELLIRMRVFSWEDVETFIQTRVILTLEKFIAHPLFVKQQTNHNFDFSYGADCHGLDWSKIKAELTHRQQHWQSLAPTIPSMDAVPLVGIEDLKKIDDRQVREHLKKWVDGRRDLVDIARGMGKDPLKVAHSYAKWANSGWVSFEPTSVTKSRTSSSDDSQAANTESLTLDELPAILSVDDSPIVQTSIKRALSDRYKVFLVSKATEALKILNEKPIRLLLLDLTMPDIDGLEFCRTIRKIPKFQNLPIVMVTARDGLIDKMKGHIAGTSRYLTKPFQPEELREIVDKCISTNKN